SPCRRLEGLHVDQERSRWVEEHELALHAQVGGRIPVWEVWLESVPCHVQRLVQVVGPRLEGARRPQQVDDVLAWQAVRGREGQQLDEARGLAQTPREHGDDPGAGRDVKAAKKLNSKPREYGGRSIGCRHSLTVPTLPLHSYHSG